MMEENKTYSADVPLYITNPIFQLVAVLLIIANCTTNKNNTASIGRIMLYMWGLGSKTNLQKLVLLKKAKNIGEIPVISDMQIITVVRQCANDNLVSVGRDGLYALTSSGAALLYKLRDTNLYQEIYSDLNAIGKLPETYLTQLKINWYAEV